MNAIGYIRVSTDAQAESGAGLGAQRAAIRAACSQRGWTLVDVYEDAGASGRNLDRPGVARALEAVRPGTALVVSRLDRLSRSVSDAAALMERARREGWHLVALDLGVDTSTPAGRLVATVLAAVAQWEREVISERIRAAMAAEKAKGRRFGAPPQISTEVRARVMRARAEGLSYRAIVEGLERDGVPPVGSRWHETTVRRLVDQERRVAT